jgi:hypothetical protein
MVVGFQIASWYSVLFVAAAFYVFWTAVFDTGRRHARAIKWRFFPAPPKAPIIVMGGPAYHVSVVPLHERLIEQEKPLTRLMVSFLIENKEALVTVTKLEVGARRTDGREQRFEAFKAPALAPLEKAPVNNFEIDPWMLEGLVESDFQAAFVWWVRFTAPDGTRWEIAFDGAAHDVVEPRVVPQAEASA